MFLALTPERLIGSSWYFNLHMYMINADQELSFPKGQGQQVKGQGQVCIWAFEKKILSALNH